MNRLTASAIGLGLALGAILATVGLPRLIGYHCTGAPLGLPQLARHEDDFTACAAIERIPLLATLTE